MPVLRYAIEAELPGSEPIDLPSIAAAIDSGDIDLVVVLGPTASGKTKFAVKLAHDMSKLKGCPLPEILSCDSRQVYRGMDIGTGKDLSEYGDVPYHLIDICPAGSKYNVYRYQKDFAEAYTDIRRRGRIPILCGGTGLYIEAACCGYDFDKGEPQTDPSMLPHKPYFIGALVTREVRNRRIDIRLEARLREGLIDEIRTLLGAGIPPEDLIYYGLEYKFVTQYVIGELGYEEMVSRLSTAIHQFAKRQMTWFRGMERDGVTIHWTEV